MGQKPYKYNGFGKRWAQIHYKTNGFEKHAFQNHCFYKAFGNRLSQNHCFCNVFENMKTRKPYRTIEFLTVFLSSAIKQIEKPRKTWFCCFFFLIISNHSLGGGRSRGASKPYKYNGFGPKLAKNLINVMVLSQNGPNTL